MDAQDLGYETSGRSETEVEREEGSSTGRPEGIGTNSSLFLFRTYSGNLIALALLQIMNHFSVTEVSFNLFKAGS